MEDYVPPLDQIRFTLDHVVDLASLLSLPKYEGIDTEVVGDALAEAGRFFTEVVGPLNRIGDEQGSVLQPDGTVKTPDGWADAYRKLIDAGWGALPFDPDYGGGGFPDLIGIVIQEMVVANSLAFSMAPLLTQGAIHAIESVGDEITAEKYLRKLVTGEWTGTMNLTEPEAGSDVGALRTKAEPNDDGSWRITGQKIFITFGDHDMADNIVHLVLARTPGAPPGTKGISCFVVPKYLVNDDGSLGEANDVKCVSLEHKMGIKASPTCVMSYGDRGGATGWLLGEENQGMRVMFVMMNMARISVGVEGLGLCERAYQAAVAYAKERRQGRAPGAPAGVSSPIIEHPDVRRMLLTMKCQIDALRSLIYLNGAAYDRSRFGETPEDRESAQELCDLLTPLSKGWGTDLGVEITSTAMQVFGGMGFIEETGVAQLYRDARIAPIYEGTNGIQALDLVGRKLGMRGGAVVMELAQRMRDTAASATGDLADVGAGLSRALDDWEQATRWLVGAMGEITDVLAGATPYLRLTSIVVGGWLSVQAAVVARTADVDEATAADRAVSARFFVEQVLPTTSGLVAQVSAGNATLAAATF